MQDFITNLYYFPTGLSGNALLYNSTVSLTNRLQRVQKYSCASGDTHSQKGTYNTSFVPAALASCMFQITVQDPVSHIQSTECNNTTVSKRSEPKVHTTENASIRVLFTIDGINEP